jgi:hypothetical protein
MFVDRARCADVKGAFRIVDNPTRVISGIVALAGFLVALVAGLAADNPADVVLTRALLAMLACNLLGSIVGAVAHWIGTEHVERFKQLHPIESTDSPQPAPVVGETLEKKRAA